MEETGGFGVNQVLDCPTYCNVLSAEDDDEEEDGDDDSDNSIKKAVKEEVQNQVSLEKCLLFMAPLSTFITPNAASLSLATSNQLLLRGITLSFIFEPVHLLSQAQQGKLLCTNTHFYNE